MKSGGYALIGSGEAEGEDRALTAARKAIDNPLLDNVQVEGASKILVNITGGEDLKLEEAYTAANLIRERAKRDDSSFFFGVAIEPEMEGKVQVTVIATGFDSKGRPLARSGEDKRDDELPFDLNAIFKQLEEEL
jgi:cell division protein FtsZ